MSVSPVQNRPLVSKQPRELTSAWLDSFGSALELADATSVVELFAAEGWLRDRLALTWDLRTFQGPDAIGRVVADRANAASFREFELDMRIEPELVGADGGRQWVQASFTFGSAIGRCRGFVRLIEAPGSAQPVAWTVVLDLRELRGHEERRGARRPQGVAHGSTREVENWLDRRRTKQEFTESDPSVLVVGAGQSGLSIAARLGQLGLDTLVLERQKRIGDSWRNRYHSLVLHDPVWQNHLPYIHFPDTWPQFIPKDKLANWLEMYAEIMELNVWAGSTIERCDYDPSAEAWRVTVVREDGTKREIRPRHLVFATGHSGFPSLPEIAGMDSFEGDLLHSSEYRSTPEMEGRRVLVVGAGNSSHDICHDLVEAGADVTMLQRSQTYVMGSANGFEVLLGGVYEEGGPPTEDADHLANSLPLPVVFELQRELATPLITEKDADMIAGLKAAGFNTNDEQGIGELYLGRGGGYYIDVGASSAIIEGKIKVKSGAEIDHLTKTGVAYTDGESQPYDAIIFATGYGDMREVVRTVVGDEIADRCKPIWGLDDEGEMSCVWGHSGHERLWFMAGNLGFVRPFSLTLALQIKAVEEGLLDRYDG